MYLRLRGEKPFISGKAARRSRESRSMTSPPALALLAGQDVAPDPPVEQDQFPVDRQAGPHLGRADALLQVGQEGGVAARNRAAARGMARMGLAHGKSIAETGEIVRRTRRTGLDSQGRFCEIRAGSARPPLASTQRGLLLRSLFGLLISAR